LAQILDTQAGLEGGFSQVQEYVRQLVQSIPEESNNQKDMDMDAENSKGDETEDVVAEGNTSGKSNLKEELIHFFLDIENLARVKKELDVYILYLYWVHYYDFYTGVESFGPEDHVRRGALPYRPEFKSMRIVLY
jgi:hypothetical protein